VKICDGCNVVKRIYLEAIIGDLMKAVKIIQSSSKLCYSFEVFDEDEQSLRNALKELNNAIVKIGSTIEEERKK